VVVVVVVMVLVDVVASVLPTADHGCVFSGTSVHNAGVLDPLCDLAHGSAVVARPVVVSLVVVGQRHGFRFRSDNSTGNGSVLTVTR